MINMDLGQSPRNYIVYKLYRNCTTMDFEAFLTKQESIYTRFRDTSVLEAKGLISNIPKQQGGYLIAYHHPPRITDALCEFSLQVSRIVPAVVYDGTNAHTTISDFQVQYDFSPDSKTLENLSEVVHANIQLFNGVSINYMEWLLNQNTGISAGQPNQQFFESATEIINYANKNGIQLRLPWGAHITASRFLEDKSPEEICELLRYFKTSEPLGESRPEFVDVGHFIFTPQGFNFRVYEYFTI